VQLFKPRSVLRTKLTVGLAVWLLLGAGGCLSLRKSPEPVSLANDFPIDPAQVYTLACPDRVEVVWLDRPGAEITCRVGPDGCIELPGVGTVRVEGLTVGEAAAQIASQCRFPTDSVRVQVIEYASRQILLFDQVEGGPRAIDYRGPERVLEVLRRAGGLSPDAALSEIHILRAQVSEGIPAEVLTVDVEAILRNNDQSTNVRVQPLDEIYIGEKPRSRLRRAVPTFLQPFYEGVMEFIPPMTGRAQRRVDRPTP
jgi:protein involved in polysaccharide export with SLBB domain